MPYKLSKKSKIYGLLSLLLVFGMTAIPTLANAQEKACVMTDAGKKVCGKLVRDRDESQSNTPSQPIATVRYAGKGTGDIQLLKCSRKSSIVSCKFTLTMTDLGDQNGIMRFYSANGTKISQATDSKGEDYIAEKVIIGKSESKEYIMTSPVTNQPVSITLLFKIPTEVNTIKTLSFLTGGSYYPGEAARFSNISISR